MLVGRQNSFFFIIIILSFPRSFKLDRTGGCIQMSNWRQNTSNSHHTDFTTETEAWTGATQIQTFPICTILILMEGCEEIFLTPTTITTFRRRFALPSDQPISVGSPREHTCFCLGGKIRWAGQDQTRSCDVTTTKWRLQR